MERHRVALVTGGSRGIGRAVCGELARLGYAVVVNFVARVDAATETVAQIAASGGLAVAAQGDVGVCQDRKRLLQVARERFGRLDLLVNNAGITLQGRNDLLDATEESWDAVFDTNLKGPFFLAQQAAKKMIRQIRAEEICEGKIINISSVSSYAVSTDRADYCLAKAAVGMMTRLLAQRLAEEKIGVFEVRPGVIASDMTAPVKEKYDDGSPRASGRSVVGGSRSMWRVR